MFGKIHELGSSSSGDLQRKRLRRDWDLQLSSRALSPQRSLASAGGYFGISGFTGFADGLFRATLSQLPSRAVTSDSFPTRWSLILRSRNREPAGRWPSTS